ncbi:MAG: hypothetical protein FWE40_07480 [Oscillospiraceae bacterium]|nr:hypothetical protein [Oscillospiraceae bacterium]
MLIPHLHFRGNCAQAIALYETAFNTKAYDIVSNHDYDPEAYEGNTQIAHARMQICDQTVFLNDRADFAHPAHLIVQFPSVEALMACYEHFEGSSKIIDPFEQAPYMKLGGNFQDKFGIIWGFMAV